MRKFKGLRYTNCEFPVPVLYYQKYIIISIVVEPEPTLLAGAGTEVNKKEPEPKNLKKPKLSLEPEPQTWVAPQH